MMNKNLLCQLLICTALGFLPQQNNAFSREPVDNTIPGSFIIKLKPNFPMEKVSILMSDSALSIPLNAATFIAPQSSQQFLHVKTEENISVEELKLKLRKNLSIEYIEQNRIWKINSSIPKDPNFSYSWHLHNDGEAGRIGQVGIPGADIQVVPLWQNGFTGKKDFIIAVVDTGVDWKHPDLLTNIFTNKNEIPSNGIDDDQNGYIDDVHGWNSITHSGNSIDDHEHGTHCAGIIGAVGNNAFGSTGVLWKTNILPIKFLNDRGSGDTVQAIEALEYARKMGAKIISNSWGGDPFSQALSDEIDLLEKDGILFIVAAGNETENNDELPTYPAAYTQKNIITVAATDNRDQLAEFSNYGPKSVHIAAPGLLIYSTIPNANYDFFSGTSMAAPQVAAAAALIWSYNPELTYQQVKERLLNSCDINYNLKRKVQCQGRMNLFHAFYNIPTPRDPDESLWKSKTEILESAHPYAPLDDKKWEITIPNAKFLRVHFSKIETDGFDKIFIESPKKEIVETLTGEIKDYTSELVLGNTLVIHFKADYSLEKFGFAIDRVDYIF